LAFSGEDLGENSMAHQEFSQASIGVPEKAASALPSKERRQTLEVDSDLNAGAEMKVGERIREVRKSKRIRQKVLARMVGISPGALTNFEKGRRRISLDWLQKIAEALDTPVSYFLPDEKDRTRGTPGDPRERRLLTAWRQLGKGDALRADFLQLLEHLGRAKGARKAKRRVS
jgi:transcriptional regulator with XRE-family HTH domain